MDKSSSLKLEPESELQRQGEELVRLRKREAELQELVSQKDYALARLQDDYDREQMHISSLESELRSRTGSEEDIKKQSDLQQELDKTNALLEASLTRNRTLEEALKESQARETNAISERCQLDEHKHQLLDAVHSIAKDENMLLRSIIEQLKEEIAR